MKQLVIVLCVFLLAPAAFCVDAVDKFYLCADGSYRFYSADKDDQSSAMKPFRARIVNSVPLATTWYFDSKDRNASINFLGVSTKTYKPYPAQYGDGHYSATVKVYLTGPSICQSLYSDPLGGYTGFYEGGGKSYQARLYEPIDYSKVNCCTASSKSVAFANYGYPWYNQLAQCYDVHYGDRFSTYTMNQLACYMLSMTAAWNSLGVGYGIVNPLEVQHFLYEQADGFGNHVRVNPFAALRFVNGLHISQNNGKELAFKRNVPLNEANDRGLATQVSVHNRGHWVNSPARKIKNELSQLQNTLNDSMVNKYHFDTLQDFWGFNLNDTRCWYWKNTWYGVMLSEVDWGLSGFFVATESNVGVALVNSSGQTIETGAREYLEDATTVTTVASVLSVKKSTISDTHTDTLVDCGMILEAENIPSDNYTVKVTGAPGTPYSVTVSHYDETGYPLDGYYAKVYSGIVGDSGHVDISAPHLIATALSEVVSPEGIADGTELTYYIAGTITAVIPGVGCYIQSPMVALGKKPIFIKSNDFAFKFGQSVSTIRGKVVTSNGQKSVEVGVNDYINNQDVVIPTLPAPVGSSPELVSGRRGTWHLYTRTVGKVTESASDHVVLNGCLKVWASGTDLPIGSFVQMDGVEHGGEFYIGKLDSIVRI
jgi:hypothetical protein